MTKGGQDIHQVMQTQRFVIEINNSQEITVRSILGNEFTAKPLSYQDIENIFIGDKNFITIPNLQNKLTTSRLELRPLSQHHLQEIQKVNTKKPSEVLKNSAVILLKKVYHHLKVNLENLWENLDKSEQFDLKVTQWLILESLFSSYFFQLKPHNKNSEIKNLYSRWKNIKHRLSESEIFSNPEEKEKYRNSIIEEERNLKNRLQDLLETNGNVQNDLLKAVKEKIENHYRYTRDSIPFELFQNADDANVELKEIYTPETIPNKPQFVIHIKGQTISFIHWGRMINQYRGNNEFDGKSKGFNNDLEKMLTLAASEKEDIENLTLTGKFGLGFKSVFLATDVPKIISGRLSFQVLAGVYPKLLPSEQIDELKSIIKAYEENKQTTTKATIISLDLAKDRASSEEVLKRFLSLFSFLLVFAKQINQCEIYNNSTITKASWKKHPFLEAKKVFIGELHELYESKFSHIKKLLVFEGQDSAIAISITPNGCISLDDIPSIWVTAPTKEETRFGFAINGHFALDIGRTQLPIDDTKNRELALKIGKDIAIAFCEFFQSCERNQTEFYNLLELSEYHRNNYYFWESFWKLLTDKFKENSNSLNEATLLITIILWGSNDSGLAKLYSACNSLPNMLYDNYKILTRFDLVKFCTFGLLEEEPIFKTVSQWDVFKQEIKPQEIISKTKVKVVIENVENILSKVNIKIANLSGTCWNIINSKEVNLYEVLKWITKQGYEINPAQASLLGEIFNPDLINKYSKQYREETNKQNKQYKEEIDYIKDELKLCRFLSKKGYKQINSNFLILSENEGDEYKRARFAPDDHILADEYDDKAKEFFKFCRQKLGASAEKLVEWGINANSEERKLYFLDYLINGDLNREVKNKIKEQHIDWLVNLRLWKPFNDYFKNAEDRRKILLEIQDEITIKTFEEIESRNSITSTPHIPSTQETTEILEKIYDWWQKNQNYYINKYEAELPFNTSLHFDQENKQYWLNLLCLGVLQTMGRVNSSQHKAFFEKHSDWFNNLPEEPKMIFEKFDDFISDRIQDIYFYQWIRNIPSFYIVAKWLDDYIDAINSINNKNDFSIEKVFNPRTNTRFQYGGPDAPPILYILGIGSCFVMRELIRNKVITNPYTYKYCYVPTKAVWNILKNLGCEETEEINNYKRWEQSEIIWEFLKNHLGEQKATFNLSFDLPFLFIADDKDLQTKFFGRPIILNNKD